MRSGPPGRAGYRAGGGVGAGFDPERTALLVIDPVNDFLSEGGAAWDLTRATVKKHDVVGNLRRAIAGARRHGLPVLFGPMAFTAEDYVEDHLHQRSAINRLMFERRMFIAGSWGADFHPDLRPERGDIVLQPHKGIDVFETDLPQHLERLGITHLVIAGMAANLCCESTGRHAMERGYHVTYLRDAMGADNMAAYEAAIRIALPVVGNAVLDVADFVAAVGVNPVAVSEGDVVRTSDHLKVGTITGVIEATDQIAGHLRVRKGWVRRRRFYIPLDAIAVARPGEVTINIAKLVIDKMPWDRPPTMTARRAMTGPAAADVDQPYRSVSATGLERI